MENQELTLSRQFQKVNKILEKYEWRASNLISILQEIQADYRYLPEEILTYVATALGVSPAYVYGVATFYAQFSLTPKGKHIIRVCDGTACHVRGSKAVLSVVWEQLGLKENENTTSDLDFTVETVACIGACALAPAMMIDEEVYGLLNDEKAREIIDQVLERDKGGTVNAVQK
ncbi:MAG: NADH-quinone oxidoreductase subunit NuoE [Atribacterota bacterium]